ncbi:MAG: hypothetical protein JNJ85_06210 [Candidatus Kapabacteria bacterium]|nr:hypothetical protein [Candidatus Kapabacteria bacterium]MBX7155485.1 hypothetical protein [Bacteroidota bacterium]
MVKTIIKPDNNTVNITVPDSYIGKEVEIICFALDEPKTNGTKSPDTEPKKTMADFWGILSDETAEQLQKHVAESRNEWEERFNKQCE